MKNTPAQDTQKRGRNIKNKSRSQVKEPINGKGDVYEYRFLCLSKRERRGGTDLSVRKMGGGNRGRQEAKGEGEKGYY